MSFTKPTLGPARFPDFLDIVRRQLRTEYQEGDLTNQGLRIFTTLDPIAQTNVQNAFKASVERLSKANPKRLKELQGAVLISHPENGELVAAVGSTKILRVLTVPWMPNVKLAHCSNQLFI